MVVSNPRKAPELVVIVNMTTLRNNSDSSCVLRVGEHPFVKHDTCMMYAGAKIVADRDLEFQLAAGQIQLADPVSPELLRRIRGGVAQSEHIPLEVVRELSNQGLVPDQY